MECDQKIAEVLLFQMRYHSLLETDYLSNASWTKLNDEILFSWNFDDEIRIHFWNVHKLMMRQFN